MVAAASDEHDPQPPNDPPPTSVVRFMRDKLSNMCDYEVEIEPVVWGISAGILLEEIEDGHEESASDWLELFYDLFFVAMAVSMSTVMMASSLAADQNTVIVFQVLNIIGSWLMMAMLRSSISLEGVSFWMLQMVSMMGIAMSSADLSVDFSYAASFICWRCVTHCAELVMLIAVTWQCPAARPTLYVFMSSIFVSTILLVILLVSFDDVHQAAKDSPAPFILLVSSSVARNVLLPFVQAITDCSSRWEAVFNPVPMNICHFSERCELLVMLLLGEAIISVVLKCQGRTDFTMRATGGLGLGVTFGLGIMFFGSQPQRIEWHGINKTKCGQGIYMMLLLCFSSCVLLFGCFMKSVLGGLPYESTKPYADAADHYRLLAGETEKLYELSTALSLLVQAYAAAASLSLAITLTHKLPGGYWRNGPAVTKILQIIIACLSVLAPTEKALDTMLFLFGNCVLLGVLGAVHSWQITTYCKVQRRLKASTRMPSGSPGDTARLSLSSRRSAFQGSRLKTRSSLSNAVGPDSSMGSKSTLSAKAVVPVSSEEYGSAESSR
eukprot:TRINITY_DN42312_c0_g1_i1.p1 TRINITY_DN42312_c0_g1~~TRINITY_DN42312_c0_g1_i1.p1  ORF type:complete len:553 (+),score=74.04 TRINITY_DN42312_c0_g1_i1:53-1711(+)